MEAVQGCIRWGWRRSSAVVRRGEELHRESETKDDGRER